MALPARTTTPSASSALLQCDGKRGARVLQLYHEAIRTGIPATRHLKEHFACRHAIVVQDGGIYRETLAGEGQELEPVVPASLVEVAVQLPPPDLRVLHKRGDTLAIFEKPSLTGHHQPGPGSGDERHVVAVNDTGTL